MCMYSALTCFAALGRGTTGAASSDKTHAKACWAPFLKVLQSVRDKESGNNLLVENPLPDGLKYFPVRPAQRERVGLCFVARKEAGKGDISLVDGGGANVVSIDEQNFY